MDGNVSSADDKIMIFFRYVRTRQIGTGELRRPEIIDNPKLYSKVISKQIGQINKKGNGGGGGGGHGHGGPYRPRPKRKIPSSDESIVYQVKGIGKFEAF